MTELDDTLATVLADRYFANLTRICELAAPLTNEQFWAKPYPYGNSFGHLVLHLSGNLNYYIGAQVANTGYVRDREREFTEPNTASKDEALKQLDAAVGMAMETIHRQSPEDWTRAYSAVGTNCGKRLDIVMQCASHMQHHVGQMIYLVYELKRR